MQEKLRQNLFAVLLSSAIISTVLSVFTPFIPLVAIIVTAGSFGVFVLCDAIRAKVPGSGLCMCVLILVLAFFCWVYVGGQTAVFFTEFLSGRLSGMHLIFLAMVSTVGISLAVYYFSRVRYRMYGLLLVIFIPCMLYARRFELVPVVYITLIVLIYFLLMIDTKRPASDIRSSSYHANIIGVAAVLLVFILAAPKYEDTPYNYFAKLNENDIFGPSTTSSLKDERNQDDDKLVLEVDAPSPLYLDSHVYNVFEDKKWHRLNNQTDPGYYEASMAAGGPPAADQIVSLIKKVCEINPSFAGTYGIDTEAIPETEAEVHSAIIRLVNFPTNSVLHPLYTTSIVGSFGETRYTFSNEHFLTYSLRGNEVYTAFYQEPSKEAIAWVQDFFYDFDDIKYAEFLNEMYEILFDRGTVEDFTLISKVQLDFDSGRTMGASRSEDTAPVSERVSQLVESIVVDKDSQYERATAINDYFHRGDFTYSLEYQGPEEYDGDVDYFLFVSKTGRCAYFATAMTLMGREAGLRVRYVEGFHTGFEKSDGVYPVSLGNFHAYPEVYLYGQGWTVFEPTVGYDTGPVSTGIKLGNDEIMAIALIAAGLICLAVFLVRKNLMPAVNERRFCRRVQKVKPRQGVLMLYQRLQEKLELKDQLPCEPYTVHMLGQYILEHYEVDVGYFMEVVEKTSYGSYDVSERDRKRALMQYNIVRKALKSHEKHKYAEIVQTIKGIRRRIRKQGVT